MKLTELLLSQRREAGLGLIAALLKCNQIDEALSEHALTLQERLGFKTADPLVQAAWCGLTKDVASAEKVVILHQLALRKATISDFVRLVQQSGTTDLATILAALEKTGASNSNN